MKTKEELNKLKEEIDNLNKKLAELTEEELENVNGGADWAYTVGSADPAKVLQGKAVGVLITAGSGQPAADVNIRVRGGASLTASNDPLIVVD